MGIDAMITAEIIELLERGVVISTRSHRILNYFKREQEFRNLTSYLLKQIPK